MPLKDKEKRKEYSRKWVAKRRKDWFDLNGPCAKCGSSNNLELHHVNREEKIDHRLWSWAEERRTKELSKCIVLCEDCHKIETKKQFGINHECGTRAKYGKGCRCRLCKDAIVIRFQKYRQKLREEFGDSFRKFSIKALRSDIGV